jgi:Raf kinase inhibitor-like YbhB/YbcL family protein
MTRFVLALALLGACTQGDAQPNTSPDDTGSTVDPGPMVLSSTAFAEGELIPTVYECGEPFSTTGPGDNITPPLSWTPGPAGTASYAIVVHDRDAAFGDFPNGIIHWTIYNIPADVLSLAEGIPEGRIVPDPPEARQGEVQGSGLYGYFGPCSPSSVNSYAFTVHAMDVEELELGGDRSEIHG